MTKKPKAQVKTKPTSKPTPAEPKRNDAPISHRAALEKQMEANTNWIAEHPEDTKGVQEHEQAIAELTHKLLDIDVANRALSEKLQKQQG